MNMNSNVEVKGVDTSKCDVASLHCNKEVEMELDVIEGEVTYVEVEEKPKDETRLDYGDKQYGKQHRISEQTLLAMKKFFLWDCVIEPEIKDEELIVTWIERFEYNPYAMMEVGGYGFKRCDELAKKIGFDMKSPHRILAYVNVAIESLAQGSTIVKFYLIIEKIIKDLDLTDIPLLVKTVLSRKGKFVLLDKNCKSLTAKDINVNKKVAEFITTLDWYYAEKFCYEWLMNMSKKKSTEIDYNIQERIMSKALYPLNKKQKEVVDNIMKKNVNILIGSGGTGKTVVTKTILDLLSAYGESYCLLAPTGIASSNLAEKTGREVMTVHRRYHAKKDKKIVPIRENWVIIDEIGMCGADHFKMLGELIKGKDKKILFIGDKYQLGSISAGDFLSSIMRLIQKGKVNGNIFELTEIMRSSSDTFVPYLCNMFCGESKLDTSVIGRKDLKNVNWMKRGEDVFDQVDRIMNMNGWNFENTAVILPQRVGVVGCNAFNKYFQSKNPNSPLYQNKFTELKIGDALMQLSNDNVKKIYNGERVNLIGKNELGYFVIERLQDKKLFEYDEHEIGDVGVSYANTIFKLQGCGVENVIFLCLKEHGFMLSRNVIYTSLSRTIKNLTIVYDYDILVKSSYKTLNDKRKTFLGEIADMN